MIYFVIPVCNGEIMDEPQIFNNIDDLNNIKFECIIYEINLINFEIKSL